MKKILLGSIALMLLSLGITIFQISCKKEAVAQKESNYVLPVATSTTLGGVMVDGTSIKVDAQGKISASSASANSTTILYRKSTENANLSDELWSVNIDGSNKKKISINLPNGWELANEEMARITADGKNIIILAKHTATEQEAIYKCNLDGSNVVKVMEAAANENMAIQGLY